MKRWISLGFLLLWPTLLFAQNAYNGVGSSFGINLTPPDTDLSLIYLSNMFGVVDGVLYGTGSQLLGTLFGVFNSAILVLGGIVVLYTFLIGTLQTAHQGETLGKEWSSIWIPLRTVLGISLLIPKASGYSFIQIVVMWIIVQGIGVADSMWNTALDYLYSGGIIISQNYAGSGAVNTGPMVLASSKILRSLTCVEMLQAQFTRYRNYQIQKGIPAIDPVPNFQAGITQAINNSTTDTRPVLLPASNYYGTNGVCGSISWKDVWEQLPPQLQNDPTFLASWQGDKSRTTAVSTAVATLTPVATTIVNNYILRLTIPTAAVPLGQLNNPAQLNSPSAWGGPSPNTGSFLIKGSVLGDAAATYYGLMTTSMRLIATAANSPELKTAWTQTAKAKGWALAGAHYFDIVNANEQVSSVVDQSTPDVEAPAGDLTTVAGITNYLGGQNSPYVLQLQALINGQSGSPQNKGNDFIVATDAPFISGAITVGAGESYGSTNDMGGASGQAAAAANDVSSSMGDFIGGLGNSQATNLNPVIGIAVYGDHLVTVAFVVILVMMLVGFGITIGLGAIPFCSVGAAGVSIVTAITSFLMPIFMSVIVVGLTMAYYIPMIPFIIFSFGVIGWFIAVVEAILAAPLVALGISHPEGSHPILGKADPALGLLVNVFLRPTFMIFGLLLGMMVTYVGLWLVNQGFGLAWGQATQTASNPFKPIAVVIIYVLIAMQILQKGFSLIFTIPDNVMRWINMKVDSIGGSPAEDERAVGQGTKAGMEQIGDSAGKLGSSGVEVGGAHGAAIKEDIENAVNAEKGKSKGVKAEHVPGEGHTDLTPSEGTPAADGGAAAGANVSPPGGAGSGTNNASGGGAVPGATGGNTPSTGAGGGNGPTGGTGGLA